MMFSLSNNWSIICQHFCLYHTLQLVIIFTLAIQSFGGYHEKRLINDLLKYYDPLERPVANESEALKVRFGLSLQQIIDVDEKNQILITNMWLRLEWTDSNLQWNVSEYGGVKDLRLPTKRIWIPDILMYNSADEKFDSTFRTNVVVNNNGTCLYVPPGVFKSTCQIDITWFPFDTQKCVMKFGSWTYDGFSLDLDLKAGSESGDLTLFLPNGEWVLVGAPAKRTLQYYECCPEPYLDITFTIHIKRRTLYYGFNLIIPCIILSSMTLLGFSLPPDSGEKLQLGVTILLSMTVFLVQLGKILPATSESISIIAAYFASIMVMVAFSVVMTVVVLNFHHRNHETHEMHYMMRAIMLKWLPWILRMERHGIKPPRRIGGSGSGSSNKAINSQPIHAKGNKDKSLEMYAKSGPTFETIWSLDSESKDIEAAISQMNKKCHTNALSHGTSNHCNHIRDQHIDQLYYNHFTDNDMLSVNYLTESPNTHTNGQNGRPLSAQQKKVKEILLEMKFITNRMRKQDDIHDMISEWKFAATVLDRLCLIVFTLFTLLSTFLCLLSAPQLIV
ncbi:neuronal acetylcholine receptor subunit alpha-7-like [Oppia nitens]|uniref:neuronal acetylcholine receptor subunit alpha-7-like n=1 Tax=Oppia nitens TaxID=1686743 RepID=UPI0023DC584C|nr:neuronal acetylcholine receptor subunit alpha-7-like [Oppia nitens]